MTIVQPPIPDCAADSEDRSRHDRHMRHHRHAIDDDGKKETLRSELSDAEEPGESMDCRSRCGSHF